MFDQDKKVKLYIDKEVAQQEYIGVHPCDNTSTLKIRTKDILEKFLPYMNVTANIVEIIESE